MSKEGPVHVARWQVMFLMPSLRPSDVPFFIEPCVPCPDVLIFMSVGLDVKWCTVPRITTPLARKKTASLELAREGRQGRFNISQQITFN